MCGQVRLLTEGDKIWTVLLYVQCTTDHSTFVVTVKISLINNTHASTVKAVWTVIKVYIVMFNCSLAYPEWRMGLTTTYHNFCKHTSPSGWCNMSSLCKRIHLFTASGTTAVLHIYSPLVTCTHFLLHVGFPLSTIEPSGAILHTPCIDTSTVMWRAVETLLQGLPS